MSYESLERHEIHTILIAMRLHRDWRAQRLSSYLSIAYFSYLLKGELRVMRLCVEFRQYINSSYSFASVFVALFIMAILKLIISWLLVFDFSVNLISLLHLFITVTIIPVLLTAIIVFFFMSSKPEKLNEWSASRVNYISMTSYQSS